MGPVYSLTSGRLTHQIVTSAYYICIVGPASHEASRGEGWGLSFFSSSCRKIINSGRKCAVPRSACDRFASVTPYVCAAHVTLYVASFWRCGSDGLRPDQQRRRKACPACVLRRSLHRIAERRGGPAPAKAEERERRTSQATPHSTVQYWRTPA